MKILNFLTLSALILFPFFSVSYATSASYPTTSPPRIWISQLYKAYLNEQNSLEANNQPENFSDVISQRATPELKKLLKLENACTQKEGICALDYDYIVAGQDYDIKKLSISNFITHKNNGYLTVKFENWQVPTQVTFEFQNINHEWKINNIISAAINQSPGNLQRDLKAYFYKSARK